jgi:hypothetical protein
MERLTWWIRAKARSETAICYPTVWRVGTETIAVARTKPNGFLHLTDGSRLMLSVSALPEKDGELEGDTSWMRRRVLLG